MCGFFGWEFRSASQLTEYHNIARNSLSLLNHRGPRRIVLPPIYLNQIVISVLNSKLTRYFKASLVIQICAFHFGYQAQVLKLLLNIAVDQTIIFLIGMDWKGRYIPPIFQFLMRKRE